MGMLGCCLAMNVAIEKALHPCDRLGRCAQQQPFWRRWILRQHGSAPRCAGHRREQCRSEHGCARRPRAHRRHNPLAYAVPAGEEYPILLDIALSAVAAGKIIAMKELKQPIPSTWLTDTDGMPVDEVGSFST
jgi:hypothetical protein